METSQLCCDDTEWKMQFQKKVGVGRNGGDGVSASPRGTVDFSGYGDNVALLAHIWEMLVQWLENCFLQAGEGAGLGAAGRGAFLRSWGPHRGELLQRAETLLPGHR